MAEQETRTRWRKWLAGLGTAAFLIGLAVTLILNFQDGRQFGEIFGGKAQAAKANPADAPQGYFVGASPREVPSQADISAAIGTRELRAKRLSGVVVVRCRVTTTGNVDQCGVIAEAPKGYGVGDAAVALAEASLKMSPATLNGRPIEAWQQFEFAYSAVTHSSTGVIGTTASPRSAERESASAALSPASPAGSPSARLRPGCRLQELPSVPTDLGLDWKWIVQLCPDANGVWQQVPFDDEMPSAAQR